MKILNKKVYREILKKNKFRSAVIIITITLTVGFLFGLANLEGVIYSSYDLNMEKLNTPELRLHFDRFIDEKNITSLLENQTMLNAGEIENIEGRLFLHAKATYNEKTYEALWIALNTTQNSQNKIDQLRKVKGVNYFEGVEDEAFIGFQFSDSMFGHKVKIDDKIDLKYQNYNTTELNVIGTVQSNEFTYNVDDRTNVFMLGDRAVIYTSLEWAWNYLNKSNVVNQLLVDTAEMSEEAAAQAYLAIEPELRAQNAPIYKYYTSWTTPDRQMFEADAGVLDKFSIVIGAFSLIMGIILIYNSLTKMINSQRTYIGLLEALGSKRRTIMYHYTAIGLALGVIGIIIGLLFSFLITYLLTFVMLGIYGFKYIRVVYDPVFFFGSTIITLGSVIFFSVLASFPILQITPREAMVSTFTRVRSKQKSFVEITMKKIPGFKSISSAIPLRELFMNKKRSSLTIIAIAVSSIILIMSGALIVDMLEGIDRNYSQYKTFDGRILFTELTPVDDLKTNITTISSEIDKIEPWFSSPVTITHNGEVKDSALDVVLKESELRKFNIISGSEPIEFNEILIGLSLASDANIKIDDTIQISLPNFTIPYDFTVVGLVGELVDVELYTYLENFDEILTPLGYNGTSNGALFTLKEDALFSDAEEKLYDVFAEKIIILEDSIKSKETLTNTLEVLVELISVFILLGILMTAVFSFNTMYLAYIDREMEYLALRAQGMKRRTLFKILSIETIFLGSIGFLLSVPIGYYACQWGFNEIMEGRYYIEVWIPLELWLLVFILSVGSVMLATVIIAWRINRANMPDVLRNRQIG
ncbi:MAG: ABC transporter permease [Candidatus Hodarchaeales archaeon]|jgi:ABC-type lipoprotein release transport system permease subunit